MNVQAAGARVRDPLPAEAAMQGVITRAQVLAHPVVIVESFGLKVLFRALFAGAHETFLEIVRRSAEEEAHEGMDHLDLIRTVRRFIEFEARVRDVYRCLAQQLSGAAQHGLSGAAEAAAFFATIAGHEEGHAIVLTRVQRELRRGRLWKDSESLHLAEVDAFEARLAATEAEVRRGVTLARALAIVEALEGSEINVVFETLSNCVDMRSRQRFERFFVLTQSHLAFCHEQIRKLREQHAVAMAS